jgi:hypothetical protein
MAQTQDQVMIKFLEVIECAICMDIIEGNRNVVTTECGHTFHCKCMMTNVAHNGFACPLCRSEMVEMPEEEEDEDAPARYDDSSDDEYDSDEEASRAEDYDGESDYGDDLEDIINYHKSAIQEETENHMLRGFRWMFQRETEDDESDSDADASDNEDVNEEQEQEQVEASELDEEDLELERQLSVVQKRIADRIAARESSSSRAAGGGSAAAVETSVSAAAVVETSVSAAAESELDLETGCSIGKTEQCLQVFALINSQRSPFRGVVSYSNTEEESSEDEEEEDE